MLTRYKVGALFNRRVCTTRLLEMVIFVLTTSAPGISPRALSAADDGKTIELSVQLVDAGSKKLGDKFKDGKFRAAVQDKVNEIWAQVDIKFNFQANIEKIDKKSKKAKFEHHNKDKGTIHIFMQSGMKSGNNAEADFVDQKNKKPGEGIATIQDGNFAKLTHTSPKPQDKTQRVTSDCESLAETIAHELGHILGLEEVDTSHVEDSWKNLMWTRVKSRMGTELANGSAGDLKNNQKEMSRRFACAIAKLAKEGIEDSRLRILGPNGEFISVE